GDATYFIMDFVEGVHLDEYLSSYGGDLEGKLAVFQIVCRAVADAHSAGVTHRDLKPRNILVDAEGQPHILDFGICAVDPADWSSWARGTITHAGDIIGTLRYMSPEQAWGGVAGPINEQCDIWSLGILLYEIVTGGGYPYSLSATPDKPAHEALLERIRKELPRLPRLGSLPRGRDLEVLLQRCLAWEPDRRIETAARLADDLDRYCTHRRIKTKPLRIPYRIKRVVLGAATRSRWIFSVLFIATLGVTLWLATSLMNIGWHVTGRDYQGLDGASAVPALTSQARDGILMVGVFDDTVGAVVDFAVEKQIDGVTASILTWRAVHGRLMERLATAGPKAVAWDYYFRTPQPGDARLVAGVEKLEDAGIPVVLAALTYGEDGTPDLSPNLTGPLGRQLRHGAIVARDMVDRPGDFVIALKRTGQTIVPSLALTTLAAVLHPDTRLDLDWPQRSRRISLLYELEPGAYLREHDRIEVTKVFQRSRGRYAVRPGDLLACSTFPLDRPEQWAQRTVSYERLLSCPDEELQALAKNKLIIIGDLRTPRIGFAHDRHPVKYGMSIVEDVPGCYLLADAVAGLLDGRYMKSASPLPPLTYLLMLAAGAAGCLLPIRLATKDVFHEPGHRRYLWAALLGLSASCFLVMVAARSYAVVNWGMVGFSLFAPMAGSFWVELARNRHRILDRNRRAIDNFGLTTDGTITLAPKRRRSLLTAG
ncbi:MAG: protein kinase, partial [Phycisphaerales bacterium]